MIQLTREERLEKALRQIVDIVDEGDEESAEVALQRIGDIAELALE